MKPKPRVLVVDDDANLREAVAFRLGQLGYETRIAGGGEEALGILKAEDWDVIVMDLQMPRLDGIETLKRIREGPSLAEVIIMTAASTREAAIEARRLGAHDYVDKPIHFVDLDLSIRKAYEKRQSVKQEAAFQRMLEQSRFFPDIIGESAAMKAVVEMIRKVGPADCAVLIEGPTGTGKELVARSLHRLSPRAAAAYVSVNCASLPAGLLESELFGHEAGAFTGATRLRRGLFEVADGGTVFLDEVGEMGAEIQPKLLRVLEGGEIRRVGGNASARVDVRVIAATNRDLKSEVREGRFREDLLYRLNTITLRTPALTERRDDIPFLVAHFLDRLSPKRKLSVSPEAMRRLAEHGWPGNVRELRNTVERLVILADGPVIEARHLPPDAFSQEGAGRSSPEATLTLQEVERRHIERVLAAQEGNKTRAAKVLGISKSTLFSKLKDYGFSSEAPESR